MYRELEEKREYEEREKVPVLVRRREAEKEARQEIRREPDSTRQKQIQRRWYVY